MPGMSEATNSPEVTKDDIRVPRTGIENSLGTGNGDAEPKMSIGETEKNLSGGGRGWGR